MRRIDFKEIFCGGMAIILASTTGYSQRILAQGQTDEKVEIAFSNPSAELKSTMVGVQNYVVDGEVPIGFGSTKRYVSFLANSLAENAGVDGYFWNSPDVIPEEIIPIIESELKNLMTHENFTNEQGARLNTLFEELGIVYEDYSFGNSLHAGSYVGIGLVLLILGSIATGTLGTTMAIAKLSVQTILVGVMGSSLTIILWDLVIYLSEPVVKTFSPHQMTIEELGSGLGDVGMP